MMTVEELIARRDTLRRARYTGTMTVEFTSGTAGISRKVTYKSDSEMAAALASIEAEISKLTRGPRPRTFHPQTTKGLT